MKSSLLRLLLLLGLAIPACETFKAPVSDTFGSGDIAGGEGDGPFIGEVGGIAGGSDSGCPSYKGPVVQSFAPWHPALYFWASEVELAKMRSEKNIFEPLNSRVGGDALQKLRNLAVGRNSDDAVVLSEITQATQVREAWPYPWANRFALRKDLDGNERNIVVRVVLRQAAWLAAYDRGIVQVYDREQNVVPYDQAGPNVDNIAGIYLIRDPEDEERDECGAAPFDGKGALRSFVLLEPSTIQRWEVGSNEIAARLESDEIALRDFLLAVRANWLGITEPDFADIAACTWQSMAGGCSPQYLLALSSSGDAYLPDAPRLAALVTALDETSLDHKFQVLSPPLPQGMGGAGGGVGDDTGP